MTALSVKQYQKSLEEVIERWEKKTKAPSDSLEAPKEALIELKIG